LSWNLAFLAEHIILARPYADQTSNVIPNDRGIDEDPKVNRADAEENDKARA
jgi:hypothetical protein